MKREYLEDDEQVIRHLTEEVPLPTAVNLELTTRCNLRCVMCPKTAGRPRTPPDRMMDPDIFQKVLEEIAPNVYRVDLVGDGEVLLAGRMLEELLERTKKLGVMVNLCTNGVLLDGAMSELLIKGGLHDMNVSLDAVDPETYRAIRGANLNKVLNNIRGLNRLKKEFGTDIPHLHFSMVGMKRNIGQLPELVNLASELGAETVTLQALGEVEAVREESVWLHDAGAAKRIYDQARKQGEKVNVKTFLWPEDQLDDRDGSNSDGKNGKNIAEGVKAGEYRKDCEFPWDVPYVCTDGNILPCCAMPSMGSLKEKSFREIWHSAAYKDLRRRIWSTSPPDICLHGCPGRGFRKPAPPSAGIEPAMDTKIIGLGWFEAEAGGDGAVYRWTRKKSVFFLLNNPGAVVSMKLRKEQASGASNSGRIYINGKMAGNFFLDSPHWQDVLVPAPVLKDKLLKVEIEVDRTWRPREVIEGSEDPRELGVQFGGGKLEGERSRFVFDESLEILGYKILPEKIKSGNKINITYYWRCLASVIEDYAVFVHFVHEKHTSRLSRKKEALKRRFGLGSNVIFQQDHRPCEGRYPFNEWTKEEVVAETYELQVPGHIRKGRYLILLGIWNPETGKRLPISCCKESVSKDVAALGSLLIQ